MRNEEQIKFWDNEGGDFWAEEADDLDIFLEPLIDAILNAAQLNPEDHVLDIGCGPGALTIAAAREARSALGLDLSSRLISLAKKRAERLGVPAAFLCRDAAVHQASPPADAIISRIGVMFFDQPIEAFAKIRREAATNAKLTFASWAPVINNPWIVEVAEVLEPFLEQGLPAHDPNVPSPFSLSDPNHVQRILERAGWKEIAITHCEIELGLPADSPEEAAVFFSKINPAARSAASQGIEVARIVASLAKYYQQKLEKEGQIIVRGAALIVNAKA